MQKKTYLTMLIERICLFCLFIFPYTFTVSVRTCYVCYLPYLLKISLSITVINNLLLPPFLFLSLTQSPSFTPTSCSSLYPLLLSLCSILEAHCIHLARLSLSSIHYFSASLLQCSYKLCPAVRTGLPPPPFHSPASPSSSLSLTGMSSIQLSDVVLERHGL